MMPRTVAAEALDSLAANDPQAQRSRRDLRRVHQAMGTRGILLRAIQASTLYPRRSAPLRVLELGAGDGTLMLGVAQALAGVWPMVDISLLDRQNLVQPATLAGFGACGWSASPLVADALDWAAPASDAALADSGRASGAAAPAWDLIVANLFLHHFEAAPLARLLAAVGARSRCFLACEPRRAGLALVGSHLIGLIGANAVTRDDAVLSVHAGFRDHELSALWSSGTTVAGEPDAATGWTLAEYPAGLFSHCFRAERRAGAAGHAP